VDPTPQLEVDPIETCTRRFPDVVNIIGLDTYDVCDAGRSRHDLRGGSQPYPIKRQSDFK